MLYWSMHTLSSRNVLLRSGTTLQRRHRYYDLGKIIVFHARNSMFKLGFQCTVEPLSNNPITNDHPSYTTTLGVTDSVFCLCGPWPTTIPQTRPTTGSDGIVSLTNDHFEYSALPRIAGGASTSVPNGGLLQCNTQTPLK